MAKKMYERHVCLENGKNNMKSKKKGLFGEALFLTTSHLVVLVSIQMCGHFSLGPTRWSYGEDEGTSPSHSHLFT